MHGTRPRFAATSSNPPFGVPKPPLSWTKALVDTPNTFIPIILAHEGILSEVSRKAGRNRDSAHNNEQKLTTLSLDEFLHRFLLHVLPKGFVRIRHFGFMAHRRRAKTLPLCFQLLGSAPQATQEASTASARDLWFCPKCGGEMTAIERFTSAEIQLRSPPLPVTVAA